MSTINPTAGSRPGTIVLPSIPLLPNVTNTIGRQPGDRPSPLQHPLVAARHVEITLKPNGAEIRDLGAGTLVNGRLLRSRSMTIRPNSEIQIGPYVLEFNGTSLVPQSGLDRIQLSAQNLCRSVGHGSKKRVLLDDISLVFRPGEFVCLMGSSGCGKSTLIGVLGGRTQPDQGTVGVNQRNLHEQFEQICQNIVLVPQQTILHAQLTVEEALGCTARLRLPIDTTGAERRQRIAQVMNFVRLPQELLPVPFEKLSGGQQKRVCLANELLSDPGLILLDEVTSGLDEKSDAEMMHLFQELARQSKTVVCITHSLNNVPSTCNLLCVLAKGGCLAFIGTPQEALAFFRVPSLGDIYEVLESRPAAIWKEEFLRSKLYAEYVTRRLASSGISPHAAGPSRDTWRDEVGVILRQTILLIYRQMLCLKRDSGMLLGLAGQTLLVAMVLVLAFGQFAAIPQTLQQTASQSGPLSDIAMAPFLKENVDFSMRLINLAFLLAVTSFWFGCNNAAKEIVRERAITNQERRFNLRYFSYLASKLIMLCTLSSCQVLVLLSVVWYFCAPPGSWLALAPAAICLTISGTTLGLLVSAIAPSEQVAVTLIPVTIIPQIILSDAIVKLSTGTSFLAKCCVTTWWGKCAVDAMLQNDVRRFALDQALIQSTNSYLSIGVIAVQSFVFAAATWAVLRTMRGHRPLSLSRSFGARLVPIGMVLLSLICTTGCNTTVDSSEPTARVPGARHPESSRETQSPNTQSPDEDDDVLESLFDLLKLPQSQKKPDETKKPSSKDKCERPTNSDPLDEAVKTGNQIARELDSVVNETMRLTPEECRRIGAAHHQYVCNSSQGSVHPSTRLSRLAAPLIAKANGWQEYHFFVIDSPEINAFSFVGGYVYFFTGLLNLLQSDDEVLFIIGHEIAHIELGHCEKAVTAAHRASEIAGPLGDLVGMGRQFVALSYSEDQEFDSDEWSYRQLVQCGHSANSFLRALERLPDPPQQARRTDLPGRVGGYIQDHFRTHPDNRMRIARLRDLNTRKRSGA